MDNKDFRGISPNTRYWMLLVEEGEGCGHTIGCGLRAHPLRATTRDEAEKEARDEADDYFGCLSENPSHEISRVVLITACEFLPLAQWRADKTNERTQERAREQEARDLAELKRLQRKLGQ